jgi:hypothetical protein
VSPDPVKKVTSGRIEVEFYDTKEEAIIRADELRAEGDPDMSVMVYQSQNYDWMDDHKVYFSVRWVKNIAPLVPHG